jgi:ketoreductase RED1
MSEKTVAVIGAGTIGLSWAALFAEHGFWVRVSDPRADLVEAVADAMAEFGAPADRVRVCGSVTEAVTGADFVQENGPEDADIKHRLFADIAAAAPEHALLLSSTSAIPATVFAAGLDASDRILVGHPFNPPHVMPLVEVVAGQGTSPDSVERAMDFYRSADRAPVRINKELPGFVGNRLQHALQREAMHLVQQDVITPADLDTLVRNSLGLRWAVVGPFLGAHLGGGPGGYRHLTEHLGDSMSKVQLGEPDLSAQGKEKLVKAVEADYADTDYSELADRRDADQLAVLNALAAKENQS